MLDLMKEAGVVGGGGAGFPTWKKLDTKAETIVLNAAECEPILETDKYYLRHHAPEVLGGLLLAAKQVEARDVAVVLKNTYHAEREALEQAIAAGGLSVRIVAVRPIYPAGDEHVAVFEATGRRVPPGGIPGMVGAVVLSVSTAYNIFAAEQGRPVTRRLLTVFGAVNRPCLLDVPTGISVGECIAAAGGARIGAYRIIMGGPMMGRLLPREGQDAVSITKTDSGVFVVPPEHSLVEKREAPERFLLNRARSVCIQCRYCTEQCPRYLLGHDMQPHKVMRAAALDQKLESASCAALCSECGMCELYSCPMGLSPRRINKLYKQRLAEGGIKPNRELDPSRGDLRDYRQVPAHRLARRIDVSQYALESADQVAAVEAKRVSIALRQHIGAPCVPCVQTGERVTAGQKIGTVDGDQLGACVHASIDGVVEQITGDAVVLSGE